jgi:hypothetical protein
LQIVLCEIYASREDEFLQNFLGRNNILIGISVIPDWVDIPSVVMPNVSSESNLEAAFHMFCLFDGDEGNGRVLRPHATISRANLEARFIMLHGHQAYVFSI